jgi:FKBP-type peptidyl-prolyl cis-trans isomerase 2
MGPARYGSTVTISFIGTLDNGRIFEDTAERGPLTFTIGAGEVFPALERAIIGMAAGQVRNIVLSAAEAYGPRRQDNIITVERGLFPTDKPLYVGQKLTIEFKGGAARVMRVTAVEANEVTLDGNHPLAGEDLTFALRVERVA